MAISSSRFGFSDATTTGLNVIDVRNVSSRFAGSFAGVDNTLSTVNSLLDKANLDNLLSGVQNMAANVAANISKMLDKIIEGFKNLKLPNFIRNALDKLTGLDLSGVKSFLSNAFKIGKAFYCANIGAFTGLITGAMNKNILSGVLIGMVMDWLGRLLGCHVPSTTSSSSNRSIVESLLGYGGVTLTKENLIPQFSNGIISFLTNKEASTSGLFSKLPNKYTLKASIGDNAFADSLIDAIKLEGVNPKSRDGYINLINESMKTMDPSFPEYANMERLKREVIKSGTINDESILNELSKDDSLIDALVESTKERKMSSKERTDYLKVISETLSKQPTNSTEYINLNRLRREVIKSGPVTDPVMLTEILKDPNQSSALLDTVKSSSMTLEERTNYIITVNNYLGSLQPNSPEYNTLVQVREELLKSGSVNDLNTLKSLSKDTAAIDDLITGLKNNGLSKEDKLTYVSSLNKVLSTLTPGSDEYNNILRLREEVALATPYPSEEALISLAGDDEYIDRQINAVRNSNMSREDAEAYLDRLDAVLDTFPPGSDEYNNILRLREVVLEYIETSPESEGPVPDKGTITESISSESGLVKLIADIRSEGLSSKDKKSYISSIDEILATLEVGSVEYNNLLKLRAEVSKASPISKDKKEKLSKTTNAKTALGSLLKRLLEFDLYSINKHTLTNIEVTILNKIIVIKERLLENEDFLSRKEGTGNFDTFDFDSVMPEFTEEELEVMSNYKGEDNGEFEGSRFNGLHPTTLILLESATNPFREDPALCG